MHTIFIYECSSGCLTLSFVKSDYVRDSGTLDKDHNIVVSESDDGKPLLIWYIAKLAD